MSLYARRSPRFVAQLASDLFVLGWTVLCVVLGVLAHDAIAALARPAVRTADAARKVRDELGGAADQAGAVPGLGGQLRKPFDAAAGSLDQLITAANGQAADIERLAWLIGLAVVVLPVLLVLALWLPRRWRFVRNSRAARRWLDDRADLDLFALRAMAGQPLHVLGRISDDPVGAWRRGDRAVIVALAEVELRRNGLEVPPTLRDG